MTLKLHNFFRSTASIRARAALNLKGLDYDYIAYRPADGESWTTDSPASVDPALLPALQSEDGRVMEQSLAIIEWLEDVYPTPPLMPPDANGRQRVRALSQMISCEIHPLVNLRVLLRLRDQFATDEAASLEWVTHWVVTTFDVVEKELQRAGTPHGFCHGNFPTMADICLYAQVWNNRRFGIDISRWPAISKVFATLDALPVFQNAAPPNQPDHPS